jgi:ribosomal protein L21E
VLSHRACADGRVLRLVVADAFNDIPSPQVDTIMEERARRAPLVSSDALWQDFGTGEHVVVHGLTKAPQYNGKHGVIERWEGDRFVVKLEGKAKGVKIKPENLKPLAPGDASSERELGQIAGERDELPSPAFSGRVRER